EIHRLLVEWNNTGTDYPRDKTIHQLFEEQAEKTPDYIALHGCMIAWMHDCMDAAMHDCMDGGMHDCMDAWMDGEVGANRRPRVCPPQGVVRHVQLTYNELNDQSDRLAGLLIEKGVLPDDIIAIKLERSIEMIIGIMGILKSGGAYLPIDPGYPQERIDYMLKDSGAQILITNNERNTNNCQLTIVNAQLSTNIPRRGLQRSTFDLPRIQHSNLAYVIYTSGSTGRPKGVMVEHHNVIAYINGFYHEFFINERDTVLQQASFSFDVFVEEIYPILLRGGKIAIASKEVIRDPDVLFDFLLKHDITIISVSPLLLNEIDKMTNPGSIRILISGGDVLKGEYIRNLSRKRQVYNTYGPTETTVCASYYKCSHADYTNVPIGKPIANYKVYVLDRTGGLLPIGVPGELCIAGNGVTRGYLNRPELTAERFKRNVIRHSPIVISKFQRNGNSSNPPNDHCPMTNDYFYKTGDLARWLNDGNIEFLGRLDQQVKIRGFRIELGEIETKLLKHPGIKEVLVSMEKEERGDIYLCAYYVAKDEYEISEFRDYLAGELPDYMIPSFFVQIEKFPLTVNGKIDYRALPKPSLKGSKIYIAPRDEIEKKLVEIWADILGLNELNVSQLKTSIGIDDNFFQLGGHSLKTTILAARIHKIFNVKIPLTVIFKKPTIRYLSEYIVNAASEKYTGIETTEKKEYYILSSAQKRMYILQQMDKKNIAYNIPAVMTLQGTIDKDILEQSIKKLIMRHEILRTSFFIIAEEPVQKIHDYAAIEIELLGDREQGPEDNINISLLSAEHTIEGIIKSFIRAFDLEKAPLLRVGLIKLEAQKHIFLVDMHHIISDGMSIQVLVQDFSAIYSGIELKEIKIQYKDYAAWQNRERLNKKIIEQSKYWEKEFEGEIPVLELPTDYARSIVQSFDGNRINFEINRKTTEKLKILALDEKVTIYIVLLAAYNILLSKLSNQEDIVIGSPTAGRSHADLEKIIGIFVNTLALRNYPSGERTFTNFLEEVKKKTLKAFENQEYQYEDLIEKIAVTRVASRNPLFDTMFVLQNTGSEELKIHGLNFVPYQYENKTSKFDLTLIAIEVEEKILFNFEYCTKLFREETIKRFIVFFKNILNGIIENKKQKIAEFEIISEEEKNQVLIEFNNTCAEYPMGKTLHGLFAEQAAQTPDYIALHGCMIAGMHDCMDAWMDGEVGANRHPRVWTYRQLNEQSDRLAGLLIEKGVLPDNIVAIMMERSVEMIIGLIGILKSGAAYLPIDSGYPKERIDYMLKDSQAHLTIDYEFLKEVSQAPLHHSAFITHHSNHLAYVIYTSGTSGKPKAVLIEHRNAANTVHWFGTVHNIGSRTHVVQIFEYTFDPSVDQIFGTLIFGASLFITSKELRLNIPKMRQYIISHTINIVNFVPAFLKELLCHAEKLESLHTVISGAEKLDELTKEKIIEKGYRLFNIYGPTETTIDALALECSSKRVSLGKPIFNVKVYILDNYEKMVPIRVVGELYITGAGVARGYLNKPEFTAEKFIPLMPQMAQMKNKNSALRANFHHSSLITHHSPLTTHHSPVYKTGDLARWLPDGNIEFLGRIDHQIKISGFRIEIAEIEQKLLSYDGIEASAVIVINEKEENYLCAYFTSIQKIEIRFVLSI
ncbi:MAG: amino acid adenylation domain-containing protein, partial [Acidobacteria bacterium]|nr:amino acid adenylation domain-containing protein [Acidobacteriota bacterium]